MEMNALHVSVFLFEVMLVRLQSEFFEGHFMNAGMCAMAF